MLHVLNIFIGDGSGVRGCKTGKTVLKTCLAVARFQVNVPTV
jgi:hypothetical protein